MTARFSEDVFFHEGLPVRRLIRVGGVVDLDENGAVLSIEILELGQRLAERLVSSMADAGSNSSSSLLNPRIFYDVDCNALAIKLREGRSVVQPTAIVTIALGPRMRVVSVNVMPER